MELAARLDRLAAVAADLVQPGTVVGLGTGSTADAVIRELGRRVAGGLVITGVATSRRTESLAREVGIPLETLDAAGRLDLGIDGIDEIDPALDAIKGRGGALLREKLVALACAAYILVGTTEKCVATLGERTPLPVEVVPFGWPQTAQRLAALGMTPELRITDAGEEPWRSDNGGYILDCAPGLIHEPRRIAAKVKAVPGVVEHGLFLGIATSALLVDPNGAVIRRERPAG